MNRTQVVNAVTNYFNSRHWQNILNVWLNPDEDIYHFHAFVDNQVYYKSLQLIVEASLKLHGLEIDREIDLVGPGPGRAALHGIHPYGKKFVPLLDWFWEYSSEKVLEPMDNGRGEGGLNMICWGKSYMEEWWKQFSFKQLSPIEEEEAEEYFKKSRQWKELLYLVEHFPEEEIAHLHCNVEINFHPQVLDQMARKHMAEAGITICNATPCVYMAGGEYTGKITYSLSHPEEVFDIAWRFVPDVVLRPSQQYFVMNKRTDFDIWTVKMFNDTAEDAGEYIVLSGDEIKEVIAGLKKFEF